MTRDDFIEAFTDLKLTKFVKDGFDKNKDNIYEMESPFTIYAGVPHPIIYFKLGEKFISLYTKNSVKVAGKMEHEFTIYMTIFYNHIEWVKN